MPLHILIADDHVVVRCSPAALTPAVGTAAVGTAGFGTVEPLILTEPPPNYTPPPTAVPATQTPIPTLPGGISPTELKYRLLEASPDFFFCDPDYYPVARADELELALQRFPELQGDPEEFNAILAHNGLAGLSTFTDELETEYLPGAQGAGGHSAGARRGGLHLPDPGGRGGGSGRAGQRQHRLPSRSSARPQPASRL